jgi:putative ABC transport system permease protein
MIPDLAQAVRTLRKTPTFTAVATLTLALGIGTTTAIFSVVNGVLLAPLPYPDPHRIVTLQTRPKQTGRLTPRLTGGDLVDIRFLTQAFEALSSYQGGEINVQLGDRAEFTGTYLVDPDFFQVFRAKPADGRLLEPGDQDRAAVVAQAFAQRNFGSGRAALGQTLRIDNRAYEIAGVLPPGFQFPRGAEVWIPAPPTPTNLDRTAYNYPTIARIQPGVPLDTAQAQLDTLGAQLATAFPDSNRAKTFTALPLQEQMVGQVRSTLWFLMGAVGLVLLISCANVANLLLARATTRSREMAVRAALGAGRGRLIRQLLAETAVLALLGGALGLLLAHGGIDLLVRLAPDNLPRLGEIRLNRPVLAFAALASTLAGLLFGLLPAWQASRVDLNQALKQGNAQGTAAGGEGQLRNTLVVAEISLSFVLAIGAGLLFRSFEALSAVPLGFSSNGILVMYASAPARGLAEHLQAARFFQGLYADLAALPGVRSVAGAMGLPAGGYGSNGAYAVEGRHIFAPGQNLPDAGFRLASPGYFATLGIPLLRGREFTTRDRYDAPFVAVVSESLAKQSFPNEDPIGRRLRCGLDSPNWMTVVGVVGDVRQQSPASAPGPELYMPLEQHPYYANEVQVALRTAVDPGTLVAAVRQKVHDRNPEVATRFTTLETMVANSIATPRFRTFLVAVFAGLALSLAMAGVYGLMTYVVSQRTAELGIRMALGASPADLLRLILGRAALLAAVGLGLGLALSAAAHRLLAGLLFGLKPTDALTYATVLVAIGLVTLAAAAAPAWRATRIDPVRALRDQ